MILAQIAEELGRSVRAVEMAAAKLVKEGWLKYVGHKKVVIGRRSGNDF